MSTSYQNRNEIPMEFTWATTDLYNNDADFLADLEVFKAQIEELAAYNGKLIENAKNLYQFFTLKNNIILLADKVGHYATLKSDEDTANSTYQGFKAKVSELFVTMQSKTAFEAPLLMELGTENLEKYYEELPELSFYKKAIDEELRQASHTLDEKSEVLVAMTGEMADASANTYSLLSNADLKFDSVKYGDEEFPVTQSSFVPLLYNPNQEIRKAAFNSYYHTYEQFKNTFASTLQGQMKALAFNANVRKYDSTLDAALDCTNVDTSVYKNLIATVRNNLSYMHDYVSLRKKALGVKELHMYDVYAPLVAESDKKISFDEAKEDVLNAMSVYGEEYISVLKSGFDNRWIDRYENTGKRSGAYSAGSFVHPFVLLNHKDDLNSEFTLAHEMGHAMHSYLSNTNQAPIYSQYVIFVAEVASTCNEALLMQYLLKRTTDKKERAALINYFLEQFKGTLYRQTMFAEFELIINDLVANGEALTADILCDKYLELNKAYFGKDMILDKEIALEWARIPHFYYNYYVYQYATGFSAAIALSSKILKEGQPAVDAYLNFLKSGCLKDPVSLLKDAGVDMASPKPIEDALKLFGELIKELEQLL